MQREVGDQDHPLVSVVTVVRNARDTIGGTFESVDSQTFRDFEHIVIDGGSTDGTVELIRERAAVLARWSSEPDSGIAEAMNKALDRATGMYVLYLHSDDRLAGADALARAAPYLRGGLDIYAFDILKVGAEGRVRCRPRGVSWRIMFKTGFFHQGALCRRDLFARIGGFDTRYAITMDYEFFLRAVLAGASVELVPQVLAVMGNAGISSRRDWPTLRRRLLEEREVHRQHCRGSAMAMVYRLHWALYLPYRRIRSLLGASAMQGPEGLVR